MAVDKNKRIKRRVRNAYIVSTVSIALVLFLLGAVGYLIMGALNATERLKENVTVYVMLRDDITAEQSAALKGRIEKHEGVREVKYTSKDEAAAEFQAYLGDDFVGFLQENPLPDMYEVKVASTSAEKEALSALERQLLSWEGVDEVVYQRSVIDQITSNINKFNLILLLFGATLLVISLILLNNTIRVTIFSKRYIIHTMKLVGATRWFIMKPFLVTSVLQGIYAGLISWAMLAVMIVGLSEGLPEVNFVGEHAYIAAICGVLMVGGILISLVFTSFAVRKFLRMNTVWRTFEKTGRQDFPEPGKPAAGRTRFASLPFRAGRPGPYGGTYAGPDFGPPHGGRTGGRRTEYDGNLFGDAQPVVCRRSFQVAGYRAAVDFQPVRLRRRVARRRGTPIRLAVGRRRLERYRVRRSEISQVPDCPVRRVFRTGARACRQRP